MNFLLPLLIVAAAPEASIEGRYPEATEVFSCAFDETSDRDYDGWPDHWTRRRGAGFPHYVKIYVDGLRTPDGHRSLRVDLDGGGAVAYSPTIPVSPLYDYVLEGLIRTEELQHDSAWLSIAFQDEKQQTVEVFASEKLRDAPQWKKLRLGPVSPRSPEIRMAVVGLHVQPGSRADLKGTALFGEVWLGRLPRITLSTDRGTYLFADPGRIVVECRVSGLTQPAPTVDFELLDVLGKGLARSAVQLNTKVALESTGQSEGALWEEPASLIGTAQWKPPVPGVGFYRVRIAMAGEEAVVHRRELSLVVIESHHSPVGGEFGWSLPRGDRLLPLPLLGQWITQAGINWIKYPLWCSAQTPEAKVQETLSFVERLSFHGIETVGILDRLPEDSPSRAETGEPTSIADLVSLGREVWAPSLEATMTRLGTPIRWWQLGSDQDASFVGYPRLHEKIAQVKAEMDRIGCDVNLGVGWGWMTPMPEAAGGKPPWRFLALGADPPLTSRELAVYLAAAKSPGLRRWVVLQPVARSSYSVSDRAIDLVQRMTAAKIAGAEGVFVPDPFGAEHGLLNEDGSPGELFLPWRTTALMLGGSESLGTLTLPGGSQNHVFTRSGDAVMIAWRHKPLLESLPLGENTRQIDLWGRQLPVKKADDGLAVEVGPQPTFVTGLNKEVTRWQIGFRLLADRLPSVFGQRHRNGFDVKNSFPQGVEGTVTLVGPAGWNLQPQRVSFRLAVGETLRQPLDVLLPDNTGSGPHTLRADFEVVTDRSYRFSVYRPIHVGLGDVRIETATRLNDDGELEVHQRLVNDSNLRANFRCQLYAPDRRRMTTQVVVLGRGSDLKIYRLPDGKQLLGKDLWLRAEETDGPRVLNYRFTAGK